MLQDKINDKGDMSGKIWADTNLNDVHELVSCKIPI